MMKKLVASGIALALFVSVVPGIASAQTATTTTTTAQMQTLLQQIKQLQDQLAALTKQRGETVTELRSTIVLARELRQGMSGEDVKALQELLAADPDIYPEGSVTGFFGPLTAKAVMKFQQKNGLETVGNVGPKTRARLNALAGDATFACKAWGKLIAPGQLKRMVGTATVDLSHCAKVPEGIAKKLSGDWKTGTSTASSTDTTKPVISDIEVDDITDDAATLSWETNERASAVVWYSTDEDVDLDDAEKETISAFERDHELTLDGLDNATDYYFIVVATDKAGNTATSSVEDFETDV
jgi:hypothetical protein